MRLEVASTPDEAARLAARLIAAVLCMAVERRGFATLAVSGGRTPLPLLRALIGEPLVDWPAVHVFQVDERVVARGEPARNLSALHEILVWKGPLPRRNLHPMWVDRADLAGAAASYAQELAAVAGEPPVLDLIHLGLGGDGHTASLFAGDPALGAMGRSVATTLVHAGYRRMTLTCRVLDQARNVLWFVTGADKAGVVADLYMGGAPFPAGRVARQRAVLVADEPAAREARLPRRRRPAKRSVVVPLRGPRR